MAFITAQQAKTGSLNNILIHDEIWQLERAILLQINIGGFTVDVGNSNMTSSDVGVQYWMVFQNQVIDPQKSAQMQAVLDYFTQLGYSIVRITNPQTTNRFVWRISWA
jgi:hypothetical protein